MYILKNSRKDGKGTYWFDIIENDIKTGWINAKGQIFKWVNESTVRLVGSL